MLTLLHGNGVFGSGRSITPFVPKSALRPIREVIIAWWASIAALLDDRTMRTDDTKGLEAQSQSLTGISLQESVTPHMRPAIL